MGEEIPTLVAMRTKATRCQVLSVGGSIPFLDPPHAGTMRTKATRCQVLSAVGPADLQDDIRGGPPGDVRGNINREARTDAGFFLSSRGTD